MTYRVALGPAGLRLEIPAWSKASRGCSASTRHTSPTGPRATLRPSTRDTLGETRDSAVPLPFIQSEIAAAVSAMAPTPVYFGLELVRHPGVIDITPAHVVDMVRAGRAANAAGLVISWDLMHAPMDGIRALAKAVHV